MNNYWLDLKKNADFSRLWTADTNYYADGEILRAIARGYCHEENSHKVLDVDLLLAINAEIQKLLGEKNGRK